MHRSRVKHAIWLIALVCAMVWAQTAAFAALHDHSSQRPCPLCQVAYASMAAPAAPMAAAPLLRPGRLEGSSGISRPRELSLDRESSRAPPA